MRHVLKSSINSFVSLPGDERTGRGEGEAMPTLIAETLMDYFDIKLKPGADVSKLG